MAGVNLGQIPEIITDATFQNFSINFIKVNCFYFKGQGLTVIRFQFYLFAYLLVCSSINNFIRSSNLSNDPSILSSIFSFFIQHLLSTHLVQNYCLIFHRGVKRVKYSP